MSVNNMIILPSISKIAEEIWNRMCKLEDYSKVAISGGSTYFKIMEIWGTYNSKQLPFLSFYPVDERIVEKNSSQSNWKNANELFFCKLNKGEVCVFDPSDIDFIKSYQNVLKKIFKLRGYYFDLVLLGVGRDGHVASIFPSGNIEDNLLVCTTTSPFEPKKRFTITYRVIQYSRYIITVLSGTGKTWLYENLINDPDSIKDLPFYKIIQCKNNILLVDKESIVI